MKKRYWAILAGGVLGAAGALVQNVTGADVMTSLLKPFTAFGNLLRAWSLSGDTGNAGAWAILAILSLLPIIYILIARRKRKQTGDFLFLLTGAVIFGGLFLLVNPTLYVHPAMTEALDYAPELLTGGPVFTIVSMLLVSIVSRWSGGLMTLKKQENRLIFWTQALLIGSMALISFSALFALTDAMQTAFGSAPASSGMWAELEDALAPALQSAMGVSAGAQDTSALIGLLLALIGLIPDCFSLGTLDAALSLVGAMDRGWFNEKTDECASMLAVRARYTMIASVGCMAAKNVLTVLLAQWIMNWSMSFSLPLDNLLLSCGAMLLARLLSAACRVKQDNDLMI